MSERDSYTGYEVPTGEQAQKDLLCALMNVRMPDSLDEEVLKVQDEYLREENRREGVVTLHDLMPLAFDTRLHLWQGNLTRLLIDAIVNLANAQMLGCFVPLHGCADNIIGSKVAFV